MLSKSYILVLKRRDFFILTVVILIGQLASAFLVLSLIVSVFSQTESNLGVSGIILSFAIPAFLLMAIAGLFADIFDRKKIIIIANFLITLVVLVILKTGQIYYASIPLSFLYFAGNTFFIPASSAASAQLVRKDQLLVSNSVFLFVLSGGVLAGFFLASVSNFFFGGQVTLLICAVLLIAAFLLSFFLPELLPAKKRKISPTEVVNHVFAGFIYIFKDKIIALYFLIFATLQAIILFGVTLAPGFFHEIVGIPIEKSPILILPMVGIGVMVGTSFIHRPNTREFLMIILGLSAIGMVALILGLAIKFSVDLWQILFVPLFLIFIGFGAIITLIASRTVMQKQVPHSHQGTVFGASIILTSFLSALLSPFGVLTEALFGYINILIWGGFLFLAAALILVYLADKWRF